MITFRKRNMAKHYGEDLYFKQDAVTTQKYKKSSLSYKPEKAA